MPSKFRGELKEVAVLLDDGGSYDVVSWTWKEEGSFVIFVDDVGEFVAAFPVVRVVKMTVFPNKEGG